MASHLHFTRHRNTRSPESYRVQQIKVGYTGYERDRGPPMGCQTNKVSCLSSQRNDYVIVELRNDICSDQPRRNILARDDRGNLRDELAAEMLLI